MKELNEEQAIKKMREINNRINNAVEIELKLISYNDYTESATRRKTIYKKRISKLKQEAKEIYKKFEGGCRVDVDCYGYPNFDGGWECGQQYLNKEVILCPNCKEIKNIHDAIHALDEVKNGKE